MPLRHRQVGAAEGFRKIGAVDKAKGNNPGDHRIDIKLGHAQRVGNAV
ncbi:Uncharacterised protein [Klebsiella pneumoniae]|nr:Uncharacterised protein [Klebsiella pneumoniae]